MTRKLSTETDDQDNFSLRRSYRPYTAMVLVASLTSLFAVVVAFKEHEFSFLWGPVCVFPVLVPWVYIGTRYRVFWHDGKIIMQAFGGGVVSMSIEEITSVRQETSNVSTALSYSRPFRRITIMSGDKIVVGKFIDVSLKHFRDEDIMRLMHMIRDRRPDLVLPKPWG